MASLLDRAVAGFLPLVPRPIVGHFSRPYIAGETVDQALAVVRSLQSAGARTTLDILGENIQRPEEADRARDSYIHLLHEIARQKITTGVSVKLTQLGLKLGFDACLRRLEEILEESKVGGSFVRIDMEDSSCTDETLEIYRRLKSRYENVGTVIQSMLRRSAADVQALAAEEAKIRLCKGIYVEPFAIAYQDREIVRRSYVELLEILFEGGCYVGIATHDELLIHEALRLVRRHRLAPNQYEFQMLLGVAEPLRDVLIRDGHRLRVYVPFGGQWYAYSIRRLKENPQVAGMVARAAFRRR